MHFNRYVQFIRMPTFIWGMEIGKGTVEPEAEPTRTIYYLHDLYCHENIGTSFNARDFICFFTRVC